MPCLALVWFGLPLAVSAAVLPAVPADRSRFAIIVRTHNPSRSMMHRVVAWANSAASRQCEFAVSIDVTHPPGRFAAEVLRRFLPPTAHVHEYDDAAMRAAWPVLAIRSRLHAADDVKSWCVQMDPGAGSALQWLLHLLGLVHTPGGAVWDQRYYSYQQQRASPR